MIRASDGATAAGRSRTSRDRIHGRSEIFRTSRVRARTAGLAAFERLAQGQCAGGNRERLEADFFTLTYDQPGVSQQRFAPGVYRVGAFGPIDAAAPRGVNVRAARTDGHR
jgi:hypothetical protein